MTACGDDDDDDVKNSTVDQSEYTLPASGSITVTNADGTTYTREIADAGYRLWTTDLDHPATLSFRAVFKSEGSYTDKSFLVNQLKVSSISFEKNYFKRLEVGQIVPGGYIYVFDYIPTGGIYEEISLSGYFDGDVSLVSFVANETITVKFTDCSFSAGTTSYRGRSDVEGTFNGEITFALRNRNFFE